MECLFRGDCWASTYQDKPTGEASSIWSRPKRFSKWFISPPLEKVVRLAYPERDESHRKIVVDHSQFPLETRARRLAVSTGNRTCQRRKGSAKNPPRAAVRPKEYGRGSNNWRSRKLIASESQAVYSLHSYHNSSSCCS